MPRMSVEDRRRSLIGAALRVIARDGVTGATTRAISAEAGSALAGFHYAFASREALLAACFERITEAEGEIFSSVEGIDLLDAQAAARAPLLAYVELVLKHSDLEVAYRELAAYCLRVPDLRPAVLAYRQRLVARLGEVIEGVLAARGLTLAVPLEYAASAVLATGQGITTLYLETRDEQLVRRTAEVAADMFTSLVTASDRESSVDVSRELPGGSPA